MVQGSPISVVKRDDKELEIVNAYRQCIYTAWLQASTHDHAAAEWWILCLNDLQRDEVKTEAMNDPKITMAIIEKCQVEGATKYPDAKARIVYNPECRPKEEAKTLPEVVTEEIQPKEETKPKEEKSTLTVVITPDGASRADLAEPVDASEEPCGCSSDDPL
ncbi:hypothetical protein BGZ70_002945 [Mortierella alpina]|uniref:Uncharacterized protein n=1 Tax=Mortierella alpina TaxID=64518 RepID=A0A9P6ITN3_MORAP|nr:hypothetical protein BGZ70_002945 [Mortierella alpina]